MTTIASQCSVCKHLDPDTWSCPAFPRGIPTDIKINQTDHRTVDPRQRGDTVWESDEDHPGRSDTIQY